MMSFIGPVGSVAEDAHVLLYVSSMQWKIRYFTRPGSGLDWIENQVEKRPIVC